MVKIHRREKTNFVMLLKCIISLNTKNLWRGVISIVKTKTKKKKKLRLRDLNILPVIAYLNGEYGIKVVLFKTHAESPAPKLYGQTSSQLVRF